MNKDPQDELMMILVLIGIFSFALIKYYITIVK